MIVDGIDVVINNWNVVGSAKILEVYVNIYVGSYMRNVDITGTVNPKGLIYQDSLDIGIENLEDKDILIKAEKDFADI